MAQLWKWSEHCTRDSLTIYIEEKDYFLKREFSFTLKGDIYTRWKSFAATDGFAAALKKDGPYKIDIGAVYSVTVFGAVDHLTHCDTATRQASVSEFQHRVLSNRERIGV
jgi:hypothetical protein